MRKLSYLLVLAVILVFSLPAMAQNPFADVPADHWAYDAVTQAVAGGIITGFPDGTFKGSQTLTRYEVAMIIARILDSIEQERQVLIREMEAVDAGLSTSVEAMEEMLEADIAALAESLDVEVETVKRALSADVDVLQADLTTYIDALEARLSGKITDVEGQIGAELGVVDSKIDAAVSAAKASLADDVADVDARVDGVEVDLGQLFTDLQEIDFWVDVLYDKVDYVDARVDDVAADVSTVDGKVADVAADVADVDGKVAGVINDVTAVDAKVVSVAAEVGAMQSKIQELEEGLQYVAEDLELYLDYLIDLEFWVDVLYDEMDYVGMRLEEVAAKVNDVDAKVDRVVAHLEGMIADVAADVDAVDARVDDLAAQMKEELDALAAEMAAEVAAAKAAAEAAQAAAESVEVDVDISDEVAALEAQIRDAAAKADAVDAKVDALAADTAADVAAVDARVDAVVSGVDAVDARVDDLEAEMAGYADMLGDLDFWVDILFDEMDAVNERIDGVAADTDAVDARVDGVAAELDAVDIKVDALAQKVDGVDAKVDALEGRTDALAVEMGEMEKELLDRIAKTQRELSAAQATQVVAIVERMLDRYEPDFPEAEVSKADVEEMIQGLAALLDEFQEEISVLPRFDKELGIIATELMLHAEKLEDVDERLAAIEDEVGILDVSASTGFSLNNVWIDGDTFPYAAFVVRDDDPGTRSFIGTDGLGYRYVMGAGYFTTTGRGGEIAEDLSLDQTFDVGLAFQNETVTADLSLSASADYTVFVGNDVTPLSLDSLTGTLTTDDMTATMDTFGAFGFGKNYMFVNSSLSGITVEYGDNIYAGGNLWRGSSPVTATNYWEARYARGTTSWNVYTEFDFALTVYYVDGGEIDSRVIRYNDGDTVEGIVADGTNHEDIAKAAEEFYVAHEVDAGVFVQQFAGAAQSPTETIALKQGLNLLNRDFNLYYASQGIGEGSRVVLAMDTDLSLLGFDMDVDLATGGEVGQLNVHRHLMRLGLGRSFGNLELSLGAEKTQHFNGILECPFFSPNKQGFEAAAEMPLGFLGFNARFSNYSFTDPVQATNYGFGVEISDEDPLELLGTEITGLLDFAFVNGTNAAGADYDVARQRRQLDVSRDLLGFDLYFSYDCYFNAPSAVDEIDQIAFGLSRDNIFGGLSLGAHWMQPFLPANDDLVHRYELAYEIGAFNAGVTKYMNDVWLADNLVVTAGFDEPELFALMGVDLGLNAGFARWFDFDQTNVDAGLTASKGLTDDLLWTGSLSHAYHQRAAMPGTVTIYATGLEYNVADDITATADYEIINVVHTGEFDARTLRVGVSASF